MSKLQKAYERSRVPLYIQVASVLRQRIESKRWQAGQKIPTLVELEKEFHVARVTVRQAVEILREEGLLFAQQGRGTFVVDAMTPRHWVKLATDWNVLIDMIKENVPKRIKIGTRRQMVREAYFRSASQATYCSMAPPIHEDRMRSIVSGRIK